MEERTRPAGAPEPGRKRLPGPALAAVVGTAALLAAAAGYLAGRLSVARAFRAQVAAFAAASTLGGIAGQDRQALAQAYRDPERAAREMDSYSWQVPNVPTPFVGSMPEPGLHASATIGPDQFRGTGQVQTPKPAGTFRIFVTGGSTAWGVGAPDDSATIPAVLGRLLAERVAPRTGLTYEVIDAADPGWASTQERILIENRLSELEPDLVVSLSGNNEAHWGFLGFDVLWFRTYYDDYYVELLLRALGLGGVVPQRPRVLRRDQPVDPELVLARLEKNLRLAALALEPTGAHYVFALQPTLAATHKPLTARERAILASERLGSGATAYFQRVYARFRAELPGLQLPAFGYVDLAGAFDGRPATEELFLDSYHFGDRGNELLAERLLQALEPWLAPPPR